MQNRIDRLESLVLSLMHGGANVPAPTSDTSPTQSGDSSTRHDIELDTDLSPDNVADNGSDTDDGLANSIGVLKVDMDRGKSMYVGQENWHTILADITEVKNYFVCHKKDLERSYQRVLSSKPQIAKEGPTFLLGAPPASEAELRAELPPKSSILTLCGRYFNSADNAVAIVHGPTFQKQLLEHWNNPTGTPVMWLGLLYSIMCLAMLSYHKVGDEPAEWRGRTLELAAEYRKRTVQCLVAADYTKPVEYTVETLILYIFGEHSSRWDAEFGIWLIVSLVTRIAFRMGYHRDAKWFPSLTPFQAEMRRRTWAMVRMSDVIFSHLVSLPTMISDADCDTQLPNNFLDEDFGPGSNVLPTPRPWSEPTPITYMISKAKLCIEFGSILRATTRVGKQVSYDEILRFDTNLRDLRNQLPPHLKLQPLEGSRDPLTIIIARYNVEILFQKIVCLLHRKYLARARYNPRYSYSRRSAIEASLDVLGHLATLHRESEPTGRLRAIRWHVNGIATKDFLLPAMLIALELHYESQALPGSSSFWTQEQRAEMIFKLQTTRDIWHGLADESVEAEKASNIIRIMLDKIKNPKASGTAKLDKDSPGSGAVAYGFGQGGLKPEQSAAMTLGMLSTGIPLPTPGPFSSGQTPKTDSFMAEFGLSGNTLSLGAGSMEDDLHLGSVGLDNAASSLLFSNMPNPVDLAANFDWDTVANFAQSANWGSDQNFQFFSGAGDQGQQEPSDGNSFFTGVQEPRT